MSLPPPPRGLPPPPPKVSAPKPPVDPAFAAEAAAAASGAAAVAAPPPPPVAPPPPKAAPPPPSVAPPPLPPPAVSPPPPAKSAPPPPVAPPPPKAAPPPPPMAPPPPKAAPPPPAVAPPPPAVAPPAPPAKAADAPAKAPPAKPPVEPAGASKAPTGLFERPALRSVAKPPAAGGAAATPTETAAAASPPPPVAPSPTAATAAPSPPAAAGVPSTNAAVPSTNAAVPSTNAAVPSTNAAVPSTNAAVPSTNAAVPSAVSPPAAAPAAPSPAIDTSRLLAADLLNEFHHTAHGLHLDARDALQALQQQHLHVLGAWRETAARFAVGRSNVEATQRQERGHFATARDADVTLLRSLMLMEAAAVQNKEKLLAALNSDSGSGRAASEATTRAITEMDRSSKQNNASIGMLTELVKGLQASTTALGETVATSAKERAKGGGGPEASAAAAVFDLHTKSGSFNAVEFLVNRLRLLGKEETTARDFLEELQLSFRRQIVSMCSSVFLSPFRQARLAASSASASPPRRPSAEEEEDVEELQRSATTTHQRKTAQAEKSNATYDFGADRSVVALSKASPPRRTTPQPAPSPAHASPAPVEQQQLTMAAIRAEAESLERSRRLLRFFSTALGYDLSTASRYATLFANAGFAAAVQLDRTRLLPIAASPRRADEESIEEEDSNALVATVFEDLTLEDLSAIGLMTLGEQKTFASRLRLRREASQRQHSQGRGGSDGAASPPLRQPVPEAEQQQQSSSAAPHPTAAPRHVSAAAAPTVEPAASLRPSASPPGRSTGGGASSPMRVPTSPYHTDPVSPLAQALVSSSHALELNHRSNSSGQPPPPPVTLRSLDDYYHLCKHRMADYDHHVHQQWEAACQHRRHESDEPLWQAEWRRACIADLKEESGWESHMTGLRRRLIATAALSTSTAAAMSFYASVSSAGAQLPLTQEDLPVPYKGRDNSARGVVAQQRAAGMRCPRRLQLAG